MKLSIDTIAAIATPPGEAGLAVLRVSGPGAISIVARRFRGAVDLAQSASHMAHVGFVADSEGADVDQTVCTVFRAPHSYTGEDTVEITCHGGTLTSRRILEELLKAGARVAGPGEFTKRAFLNGKMDLAQAEAVADVIHSRSDAARRSSMEQLRGRLSDEVRGLRSSLIDAVSLLELELDFAEDGYEFLDRGQVRALLGGAHAHVQRLSRSYTAGKVLREGVKLVLTGAPNVGKSSLLNALLRESRAIVTDIPGTTRDVIEEGLSIGGVLFRVVDTAGLRSTQDPVEREGVQRTKDQLRTADVVVLVVDLTAAAPIQEEIVAQVGRSHLIIALNKCDLVSDDTSPKLTESLSGSRQVRLSARSGVGLAKLEEEMLAIALGPRSRDIAEGTTVTSVRHHSALLRTEQYLGLAIESLEGGKTSEFIALDVRTALEALGEITGEVTTDEILNAVFSRFCIGK